MLPTTVSTVVDTVKRARSGLTMAAPFAAPKTAFNANVTGHRNVAFAQLDLEDIKTVKNHFGVKVNDVVMALVSGVLRKFLPTAANCPTTRWSRWFRCRCTRSPTGQAATRCRACSPGWRPTSRTRPNG